MYECSGRLLKWLLIVICIEMLNGCSVVNNRDDIDLEIVESLLTQGACSRAIDILKQFSYEDNLRVKYLYGRALLCLSRTSKEEDAAMRVLLDVRNKSREKAGLGDIDAQYRLAHMYSNASSLLLEKEEARMWAKKAAKQGHKAAAYELSQLSQGEESFKWLEYSANHGYSEAQWELGNLFATGDAELGVEKNETKAFGYYKSAAENDFKMAFYDYAIDLITGDGGYQDLQEGKKWMLKAAESESIAAIKFFVNAYTLGCCGINADEQQAAYWKRKLSRVGRNDGIELE